MTLLAEPVLSLASRTPTLRRAALECVVLALVACVAEIAVALTLIPIFASLSVGASELSQFVDDIPPVAWLALFALAAGSRTIANWLLSVKSEQSTQHTVVSLQSRLYRALAAAHWDAVRRLSPPKITSALQTQSYDAAFGLTSLVQIIAAMLLIMGYLISVVLVLPALLPALVAILAIMWWLNLGRSERVLAHSVDYVDATTKLHQRYEDWVAISRIASLGVDSEKLADRFVSGAHDAASHAVNYSRSSAATRITYDVALAAAILVGVPLAWWMETPPAMLAFGLVALVRVLPRAASIHSGYQGIVNAVAPPRAASIHSGYQGIVNAVAPIQAVQDLAMTLELDPVKDAATDSPLKWRKVELAGVGVEELLPDGRHRWLLRDVTLELNHGEWIAVTGPTGAGKTTLAEVMLMLVRSDSGALQIDGHVVHEKLAGRWRDQAAYVPQDVVLFDATIRDNLRLYAPEATDDELKAGLDGAAAEFVFERLPEGLDTRTGPGGRWLSGGERQRIGIARALITQERLIDALANLEHTMSVMFITHRPELLLLADRVIGVEDGTIKRRDDGFRRTDPDHRRQ